MNDVLVLAEHAVADPNGFEAAYKTMVANAPADMAESIADIKPITEKGGELVRNGTLKTTTELRDWLANQADKAELEKWVRAQGKLVPQISQLCG